MLDGKVLIEEVNELLGIDLEDGPIDTIGGLILFEKPEVQEGENISFGNWKFAPIEMEGQQIRMIEAIKKKRLDCPLHNTFNFSFALLQDTHFT
ncbi:transporter associated domain-containing protein [Alteribacillus bidgolensis]|uniref:Transporter associated domain-containing protein n=1 Tax=Alteribacillus bidgolensis TaxID=930129 RepID=A0A1G8IPG2_9BACI|nr:transporter associated domain-containing protein [Alteribacillus bidgolensis]SDI20836.1 Transporter associated domain-containing protein [Alteribacillus bidgolensis]